MIKRILCIGDIVGRPGRKIIQEKLPAFKKENGIDFVIVNGENAASGSGITPKLLGSLLNSGVDVITTGDHIYKNKDVFGCIEDPKLLRPLNYVADALGNGTGVYSLNDGTEVAVANLSGRVFMDPCECPFNAVDQFLKSLNEEVKIVFIDMHAEATSEKIAMGWHLDGKVSVVFGTHTHIQTADERILPGKTAYITDLGMTGPYDSILGRKKENVLHKFTTNMPSRFDVANGDVRMCGILTEIDSGSGEACSINRICLEED